MTVTGPTPPSTPPKLGVLGDSLSAGDVTGTTPGWVADVTTNGPFALPPGGNQAVDGATVANLASEVSALPAGLNYTSVIIGGNDAVNLVEGNETAANYLSTVVTDVENALATLQTDGDHPVVATVPDIFDTPLVQQEVTTLGLTTTQITADKSVIQEANAEITEFALAHGIPVIDLYAATDALLTAPLTLAGVNFTTSQLFAPDGFHPSAIEQGLLGNMVIDAVDLGYGTGLAPISDQQLVTDVGDTATVTGPTYFNLAPYILTPPSAAVASETITASISTPSTQSILVNLSFGETIPGQGEGVLDVGDLDPDPRRADERDGHTDRRRGALGGRRGQRHLGGRCGRTGVRSKLRPFWPPRRRSPHSANRQAPSPHQGAPVAQTPSR